MFVNRWYQDKCERAIFQYFENGGRGNPVCALPTGTGKSVVIGNFIKSVFRMCPNQRIMMLTHVKELIQQNAEKLQAIWPTAPLGIHSAGLKKRDIVLPVIFGGVQSVAPTIKKAIKEGAAHFGHRDLLIIDECHLLGPNEDSMYGYIIKELMTINPNLKVIGFTATPYRLKQGLLTDEGGIFTDVCYDLTTVAAFTRLIAEGFLAPLIPKRTRIEVDTSNVGITRGEFNPKQLQAAVDQDEITFEAIREAVEQGHDRKSWLVFASGVENTEHLTEMLQSFGISAASCHSKLKAEENDKRIAAFKNGELRALVNNRKLTTGFDHPDIDLIIDLCPTMSPGLHVQKYGRGTRPCEGKENCLVLDFAGNTRRLGPINDPVLPKKPGTGGGGDAPIRICEECGMYNHSSARECACCGAEFTFENKLFSTAGTEELIKTDEAHIEYFDVQKAVYNLHEKTGSPQMMKVSYWCGLRMFYEFIGPEHVGFFGKKAKDWWKQRHPDPMPTTTLGCLKKVSELRTPSRIRVWCNKKYPEILSTEW